MPLSKDTKYIKSINGKVSVIGMGTWGMGGGFWSPDYSNDEGWVKTLRSGIELGMTLIDTAEMYGGGHAEELVGKAIRGGFSREELFIVTKVWPNHARYDDVIRSAKASRERLGTYIDLYLLHWPANDVPVCETMKAFEKLIDDGVVRFVGLSNFDVEGIERARQCFSKYDIAAVENRYSLLHRVDEASVIPYVQRNGLLYLAYTPLEKGEFAIMSFSGGVLVGSMIRRQYRLCLIGTLVLTTWCQYRRLVGQSMLRRTRAHGWRLSRDDWNAISDHFR